MNRPHSPVQTWSLRVPSPPRIIVPPPALNANGIPDLHVAQESSRDFESSGFANAEYLKTFDYANLVSTNSMLEWKYEERRKAQQILPFLFLGPSSAAKDRDFLQREGITMILAVRNTMSAQAKLLSSKVAQELGIESQAIDVAGNQELIAAFSKGIETINTHMSTVCQAHTRLQAHPSSASTPGKVLVFCESGNERSATLVTAYIMAMYSTDLVKAVQLVQAQRFAVAFDDSLRNLLATYEIILKAKRDTFRAQNLATSTSGTSTNPSMNAAARQKRTIDDADDYDMDIEAGNGQMDEARFEKREGYAPFQDRTFP